MVELATKYTDTTDKDLICLLKQLGRELLLLESSDWQFLISTFSARDYAENRIVFHHKQFTKIVDIIDNYIENNVISECDREYLKDIKKQDSPFSDLKFTNWKKL
jgi:1,4-alpha-glucan branching enzyme